MNAIPVTVVVVFGLVSVMVSVEGWPDGIVAGEKALVAVMPATTVRFALADAPLPELVLVMAPVLFA